MEQLTMVLSRIFDSSEFLQSLESAIRKKTKSRLFGNKVRVLTAREIKKLKAQGNYSEDWKKILVCNKFKTEHISENYFIGRCVLGLFDGREIKIESAMALPSGIHKSTIINSEVGDNCCVWNAKCISNYIIKGMSVINNVGSLVCSKNSSFGNGREISVGIETGGREVLSFAEITIPIAQTVSTERNNKALIDNYAYFIKKYSAICNIGVGIIENDCIIHNTTKIEDCYIGKSTVIDGAVLVQNCTVLGSADEPVEISHGAYVKNSCIQWGCQITSMAIVDESVLTEYSHVERHGKVTQSILGPNTGVGEGEVTASLVGPFVGFHHQALLIAAMWPEGKGNVGYGANIGSNHTSKAPDQEIWCGEGTFFGLGVNIKFPSDFTKAPYSIIATAVNALPQKVEFPFSLINNPTRSVNGIPPAYNEIFPGWVLSDDLYAVKRNEGKYKKRNKAHRAAFEFDVFRPEIIDMMTTARSRLACISQIKEFYTSKDITGLGKNFLTEESRIKGIAAYSAYIEYYALCGLKQHIDELIDISEKDIGLTIYNTVTENALWEHQRKTLLENGFDSLFIKDNLLRLAVMEQDIARAVQKTKEKDDLRGAEIIADYTFAHSAAAHDSFVKETWERAEKIKKEIEALLVILK
ncbi:MAG: DUF4954 family protein [Spirochaetes bacterium]|nr:DUF4954 family protein [Spirochaetota bacterium]